MEKSYTVKEENGSLSFVLNRSKPFFIIFGLTAIAMVYITFAGLMAMMLFGAHDGPHPILGPALVIIISGFYFLLARALMRRLSHYEVLTVDATNISISDHWLFTKKKRSYELQYVKSIFFIGSEHFTDHPLAGSYGDLGFNATENLVRYQISDGNIMLVSGKRRNRFGRNIPSWDTEEIVEAIEKFTGRSFSPDRTIDTRVEARKYRGQM